jgi:hypothetical protein
MSCFVAFRPRCLGGKAGKVEENDKEKQLQDDNIQRTLNEFFKDKVRSYSQAMKQTLPGLYFTSPWGLTESSVNIHGISSAFVPAEYIYDCNIVV